MKELAKILMQQMLDENSWFFTPTLMPFREKYARKPDVKIDMPDL